MPSLPLEAPTIFAHMPSMALTPCIRRGDLARVELIVTVDPLRCTPEHFDLAARLGYLDIVKFLHRASPTGCTTNAMDGAAAWGHLPVVQFLHTHRPEGCTTRAAYCAVQSRHTAVAQFLIQHPPQDLDDSLLRHAVWYHSPPVIADSSALRPDAPSATAKVQAINRLVDPLETLRLLYEKGTDKTPARALVLAAQLRKVEAVQYIVDQGEGYVVEAIFGAVSFRRYENFRCLVDSQRVELDPDMLTACLNTAVPNNDFAIVAYLCDKFRELECSSAALVSAAAGGNAAMVKMLRRDVHKEVTGEALIAAARNGNLEVAEMFALDCDDVVRLEEVALAALERGHYAVSKFLLELNTNNLKASSDDPESSVYWRAMRGLLDRVFVYSANALSVRALAGAVDAGDFDVVAHLVQKNIGHYYFHQAIMTAIGHGHLEIVRCLIDSTNVSTTASMASVNWMAQAARTVHLAYPRISSRERAWSRVQTASHGPRGVKGILRHCPVSHRPKN